MKTYSLLAFTSLSQLATAAVQFSFAKHNLRTPQTPSNGRRSTVAAGLAYSTSTFIVNVTVGTPAQPQSLLLSTSSWDTWLVDARSDYCEDYDYSYDYDEDGYLNVVDETYTNVCVGGTFSPGNSTSYTRLTTDTTDDDYSYSGDGFASYNTQGYSVNGDYITDTLALDSANSVTNFTMGLVNDTYYTYMGVLGLGYNHSTQDTLTDRLQSEGLINTTAYSLWVDDPTAATGSLLFGAVDTTKFTGNLTRVLSYSQYSYMIIPVVSINGSTTKTSSPVAITALPSTTSYSSDSYYSYTSYTEEGSDDGESFLFTAIYSPPDTISNLPTDFASQIWSMAGAKYDPVLEIATIPCEAAAANGATTNFTLQLGGTGTKGPIITALLEDLVIPVSEYNVTEQYSYYVSGENEYADTCLFGVQNGSSYLSGVSVFDAGYEYTLGSTLLRRTYSVFDIVNGEVAVAPMQFPTSTTDSSIVAFASYGATAPSSTLLCAYTDCYDDDGTRSGTTSSEDSSDGQSLSGVLSFAGIIGLSLGLAAGLVVLGAVGFYVWRRREKQKLATDKAGDASSVEAGEGAAAPSTGAASSAAAAATQPVPVTSAPAHAARAEPEMAETPAAGGVDKGKGLEPVHPERSPPLPPRPSNEQGGSRTAETELTRVDNGEGSSARNS